MRIGEVLFFSPNFRFWDLDFDNTPVILKAFQDRVEGFYLAPARRLLSTGDAFACGLICAASIDFLAKFSLTEEGVGNRITSWLEQNIPVFAKPDPGNPSRTLARRFYDDFRNGLVHEGRIKNLGQFSLECKDLIGFVDAAMVVNPELLLDAISRAFHRYCQVLASDPVKCDRLMTQLQTDFQKEIAAARK